MPEIKKVEIETEETPTPQPTLAESQLAMAVAFGRMTESNDKLQAELQTDKAERSQTTTLLQEALAEIRALKLQTDTTSRQVETLNESQTDILSMQAENSQSDDSDVIPVTPMMETKVSIEQKPVTANQSFLNRLIFGKKGR